MTRKKLPLAIAALSAGMLGSSMVYALGLGDIKLYSHLNEPLQAEIELIQVGDLNADEIVTKIAADNEFKKAGIEREFFLTQIKFQVELKPDGSGGVLKLSTEKPTNEPYLDFILDTTWSKGHLLKQYTLLLDPPTYTVEGVAPTVSKPEPQAEEASAVETQSSSSSSEPPQPAAQESVQTAAPVNAIPAGTEHYTTQQNDTLWRIANTHQVSGASVYQTMEAIQKLNQDAFIRNNRNLLKTNKSLRIPSPEEVAYLSQGGSVSQLLADQRNASAPQLTTEQAASSANQNTSEDKLKIVGSAGSGVSSGAGTAESIDKIDRDNQDMNARLSELTSQIKTMQQLIQLQDDQLTALQQKLGSGATTEEKRAAVQKLKDELSKVESEINKEAPAVDQSSVAVTTAPAQVAAQTSPTAAPQAAAPSAAPQSAPTAAPVVTQAPTAKAPAKITADATSAAVPVEEESSSSWIVVLVGLLLGAGAAAAVFGKKFIEKRKAEKQVESESDWSVDAIRDEPSLASLSDLPDEEQAVESAPTTTEEQAPETVVVNKVSIDPLEESSALVAQGNISGAIAVLKEAVAQNATRLDLRTRLMELSVEAGDISTFEAQESYVSRWGGAAAKQRAKELREVVDAMPAKEEVFEQVQEAAPIIAAPDLDFNVEATTSSPVEESVIEKTPEDELVSLDHLFEETAPTEASSTASEDLASLDHLFDDTPANSTSLQQPSETPSLTSTSDEMASLDHLFDDAPAEIDTKESAVEFDLSEFETSTETHVDTATPAVETESTPGEIDFSAELGFLDDVAVSEEPSPSSSAEIALGELDLSSDLSEEASAAEAIASAPESTATTATGGEEDEFGFLAGTDEAATKLDLAKAYIDMEDVEGAKDILQEVLQEGNAAQKQEANDLLAKL